MGGIAHATSAYLKIGRFVDVVRLQFQSPIYPTLTSEAIKKAGGAYYYIQVYLAEEVV